MGIICLIIIISAIIVGTAVATNVLPNPLIKDNNTTNNTNNTTTNITNTNNTNNTNNSNNDSDESQEPNAKSDPDYEELSSDEYVSEWDEATHKHDGSDVRMDQPYRYDEEGNIHLRRYDEDTGENYWT